MLVDCFIPKIRSFFLAVMDKKRFSIIILILALNNRFSAEVYKGCTPNNPKMTPSFTTFYRQKWVLIREILLNLGINHSTSILVQTKNKFLCLILHQNCYFFQLFSTKSAGRNIQQTWLHMCICGRYGFRMR